MYKIAVLGDRDSVLGFKALGLDVFPAETVDEAKDILNQLAKEEYAVVYLTEQYARYMDAELERYKTRVTPAVILIPGKEGSLGIGMANVKKSVERAVGADILERPNRREQRGWTGARASGGAHSAPKTSPRRREAARREQARRE